MIRAGFPQLIGRVPLDLAVIPADKALAEVSELSCDMLFPASDTVDSDRRKKFIQDPEASSNFTRCSSSRL